MPKPTHKEPSPGDAPSISFHSLMGVLVSSTWKLASRVNGKEVTMLIDGGSTNNFP